MKSYLYGLAVGIVILSSGSMTGMLKLTKQAQGNIALAGSMTGVAVSLIAKEYKRKEETEHAVQSPVEAPVCALTDIAKNQQKYPHIMVIGKTGSGKSTITEYLASLCPGKRYVVAPHYDATKDDWKCCHGIFCVGRNYGTDADFEVSYADIINGQVPSPTASQVLKAIAREMDARYKSSVAQDSHPIHNWIIDETPAVARALDKYFGNELAPILFEARKVGLRLFILSQSDNVETLKIKGQGKLREQFSYVYLGNCATARLRQLKRAKPNTGKRWAVVDETVTILPDLEDIRDTAASSIVPDRFIAEMPSTQVKLPKPSDLAKREPTEYEIDLLRERVMELRSDGIETDSLILKAMGYEGKYYAIGKKLASVIL